MTHAEAFIIEIDAFLALSGLSASAFGRAAVNDPNFVGDLRKGRMPNLRLVDRVQEYIRQHATSSDAHARPLGAVPQIPSL
jgi:hypothetical protein